MTVLIGSSVECLPGLLLRLTYSDGRTVERDLTHFLALTLFRPLEHDVLWQAGRLAGGGQVVLWPTGAFIRIDFIRHRMEFIEQSDALARKGPLAPLESEAVAVAKLLPFHKGRLEDPFAIYLQEPGRTHQVEFPSRLDVCLHWAIRATEETLPGARELVLRALQEERSRFLYSPLLQDVLGIDSSNLTEAVSLESWVDTFLSKARQDYMADGLTAPQLASVEGYFRIEANPEPQGSTGDEWVGLHFQKKIPRKPQPGDPLRVRMLESEFRAHLHFHRRFERRVCALQCRMFAVLLGAGSFPEAGRALEALSDTWEASLAAPGTEMQDFRKVWSSDLEDRLHGAALVAARKDCQEGIRAQVRAISPVEELARGGLLRLFERLVSPGLRSTVANTWPQDIEALGPEDQARRACASMLYERGRDPQTDGFGWFDAQDIARAQFYRDLLPGHSGLENLEEEGGVNG
jgi:hypothetical protein